MSHETTEPRHSLRARASADRAAMPVTARDDAALLREFASRRSERAFAELVRRHLDLVYSSALRRCNGNSHRAQDVVQQVFVALAQNAGRLIDHPALTAWLFTATRNAAIKQAVSDQRRRARETVAMNEGLFAGGEAETPVDWSVVAPVLDRELDELNEADRTAIVLRFFEQRSFAEIAQALQSQENAARMRTERALEKLRARLASRGIRSAGAALGVALARNAVGAAPAGLADTVVEAGAGAVVGAGVVTIAALWLRAMRTVAGSAWSWGAAAGALVATAVAWQAGWLESNAAADLPVPPSAAGSMRDSSSPSSGTDRASSDAASTATDAAGAARAATGSQHAQLVRAFRAREGADRVRRASEILLASGEAYEQVQTYQDEGVMVERPYKGHGGYTVTFQTSFVRPGRVQVSWRRITEGQSSPVVEGGIWCFESSGYYRLTGASEFMSLVTPPQAIEVTEASSLGATRHIPALLLEPKPVAIMARYSEAVRLADQVVDGEECYQVVAMHPRQRTDQMWIAKRDLLLRRRIRTQPAAPGKGFLASEFGKGFTDRVEAVEENYRRVRIDEPIPAARFQP